MRKNNKETIKTLGIIIILLLMLCMTIAFLCFILKQEEKINEEAEMALIMTDEFETIEQVITKHESTYLKVDNSNKIYVNFKVDLFEEDGTSNESYFEKLINDLANLNKLNKKMFYLFDEEKKIYISIKYDEKNNTHTILYNYQEDFYNKVDGQAYMTIDKAEIIKKERLIPIANELRYLIGSGMYFKSIREGVGEGVDLGNGYASYLDGKILLQIADYKVKSIIFTKEYEDSVFSQIKVGTPLEEIANTYNGYRGSPEEGYLMYRTEDVYTFIYEDEIIVYGYSYFEYELFEEWLKEYVDEKNFKLFIENVTNYWTNYDICTYDMDTKNAHITYPSRGIEIIIKENDFSNITLYNNYFFTDYTKDLVKDGKIKLNYSDDYLEITEKERRENFVR